MKGPNDNRLQRAAGPEGASPISKVAERLAMFTSPRGFEAREALGEALAPSSKAKRKPETLADAYGQCATALADANRALVTHPRRIGSDGGLESAGSDSPGDLDQPASVDAAQWLSVGPTRMDNGQTYGNSRVPVSGRVSCVAIDPSDRNNILCGSGGGGVWQSRDGGTTWAPRTDFAATLTTGAIAFDPSDPSIVYVGTGEGDFYWRLGQGVLRSTDGGSTFSQLTDAPFVGVGFHALVIDPGNSQRLVAGTTHGLYRSTNGGTTWSQRVAQRTWSVSAERTGSTTEFLAACSRGLKRSTNGTTWTDVALPGAPGRFSRLAVAHAPSDPSEAFAFGASGDDAFLWRRSGGTWTEISPPGLLRTGQAWYDWFLGVAPNRTTRIYLGAIEAWRGDRSGSTWRWTRISNKAGDDIHPDQHAIAFDPDDPDTVYVGCDGGLYRSPDTGTNWESLNDGLAITEIEYLAHDPGSSRWLLAGTQDNGSIRFVGSTVWDHVADGDGGDCAVNQSDPDIVFHSYYGMGMERSTTKGDFNSFSWIGPNVPGGYQRLFYPPMESSGDTIAQAGESLWVSRDNGSNWTEIELPAGIASAMYMPNPDVVYVGATDGSLYWVAWANGSWSGAEALPTPRPGAQVSDLHVSEDYETIWVTLSRVGGGRVFVSTDGAETWTDRSPGLPGLPMNAVALDPSDANRVWVAADLGVYESRDAGATWSIFGFGLPNVLVADLLFHPHSRLLRAGTRNRGVWEVSVDRATPERTNDCDTQFTGTVPANGTETWFTFRWPATWHVVWTVLPTTTGDGGPQVKWEVAVERADAEFVTYWITVENLTSQPVSIEGRYCILSRV